VNFRLVKTGTIDRSVPIGKIAIGAMSALIGFMDRQLRECRPKPAFQLVNEASSVDSKKGSYSTLAGK
jgi:hypothetical protein